MNKRSKVLLQELCQRTGNPLPTYEFQVTIKINGRAFCGASSSSLKRAEDNAANKAIACIQTTETHNSQIADPKGSLQIFFQRHFNQLPCYKILQDDTSFDASISIPTPYLDTISTTGGFPSKKKAEKAVALLVLDHIDENSEERILLHANITK